MLLWLQKKAKATHIWLQFAMIVFMMHLLVLPVFFLRFAGSRVYQFSLGKTNMHSEAPVIFAPFAEQKITPVKKSEKPAAHQKQTTKKVVPANKKAVVKKDEKPKTAVIENQNNVKPVKQEQKKIEESSSAKATAGQEVRVEKKAVANSVSVEEKKELKPTVVKDEKPQVSNEVKPEKKTNALPDAKKEVQSNEQRIITSAPELEQLAMYEFISCTIGPRWKPPCCGDSKTECQVKFSVGQDGKIVTIEIAKSSGILLFDIAARNACEIMQSFPAWARLKEFCITMKV